MSPNFDPNSDDGLRRTRSLSLIKHTIERLNLCRQVIENAGHIVPNGPHADSFGAPYLARPGHKTGWEESIERVMGDAEAALKILLRDARTGT